VLDRARSIMHTATRRVGFDIRRWPPVEQPSHVVGRPDLDEHAATIDAVRPYTMTPPERIAALIDAVEYLDSAGVPGGIVE
jgi:O-methyltransferase